MPVSRRTKSLCVAATAAALITPMALASAPAGASTPLSGAQLHITRTIASGTYIGPLQFARFGSKTYVADSATSKLWQVGNNTPLETGPNPRAGGDIAGVAVNTDNGDIAYTETDFQHHLAQVRIIHNGVIVTTARILRYEINNNPDKSQIYGLLDPARYPCAAQTLAAHHIPVRYTGQIDAHPYSLAYLGGGAYAVADAGGNDILRVSPYGNVTLIKTIPHQPVVIDQQMVDANHLDSCALGKTYYAESVPTDVERGFNGMLYESNLPGEPMDGLPLRRGSVYSLNPTTKALAQVGTNLADPTNIAVTRGGAIYVAQPFIGSVAVLSGGHPSTKLQLTGVVAVEAPGDGHLYASTAPVLVGSQDPSRIVQLDY